MHIVTSAYSYGSYQRTHIPNKSIHLPNININDLSYPAHIPKHIHYPICTRGGVTDSARHHAGISTNVKFLLYNHHTQPTVI